MKLIEYLPLARGYQSIQKIFCREIDKITALPSCAKKYIQVQVPLFIIRSMPTYVP